MRISKLFITDTKEADFAPSSPLRLYVGYLSEKPVVVQEAFSTHGIINFCAMAGCLAHRVRALMIAALREASMRIAGVQTAEASRATYERLGFKPVGRITAYS